MWIRSRDEKAIQSTKTALYSPKWLLHATAMSAKLSIFYIFKPFRCFTPLHHFFLYITDEWQRGVRKRTLPRGRVLVSVESLLLENVTSQSSSFLQRKKIRHINIMWLLKCFSPEVLFIMNTKSHVFFSLNSHGKTGSFYSNKPMKYWRTTFFFLFLCVRGANRKSVGVLTMLTEIWQKLVNNTFNEPVQMQQRPLRHRTICHVCHGISPVPHSRAIC